MPPRKRAATTDSPIVGTSFSVADNATTVEPSTLGEKYGAKRPDLPPPSDVATDAPPVEKPPSTKRATKLRGNLQDSYETLGVFVGFVDRNCGQAIVDSAAGCAIAMDEWAQEDPRVKRVLEKMLTASAFGKVVAAHAPILIAVGSHHVPQIRNVMFPPQDSESNESATVATDDFGNPVAHVA